MKKPQGLLLEGPFEITMEKLKDLIKEENPSMVISVGDIVSFHMIEHGIPLNIMIVDNKTMRKPIQPILVDVDQKLYTNNPPGAITDEAWDTIKRAIELKGRTKVIVDGEEDLLTVVTVLSAPENTLVVYGQPHKGVVAVKVIEETRERMHRIMDAMVEPSKN